MTHRGPRRALLKGPIVPATPHLQLIHEAERRGEVAAALFRLLIFAALLAGLDVDPEEVGPQHDRDNWPAMHRLFADRFRARTRDEWSGTSPEATPV